MFPSFALNSSFQIFVGLCLFFHNAKKFIDISEIKYELNFPCILNVWPIFGSFKALSPHMLFKEKTVLLRYFSHRHLSAKESKPCLSPPETVLNIAFYTSRYFLIINVWMSFWLISILRPRVAFDNWFLYWLVISKYLKEKKLLIIHPRVELTHPLSHTLSPEAQG